MAVDSKQGANTTNGANGTTASGQRTKGGRKRPSSLMAQASSLPTVEHSLEEFIAKANQTLVDVSTWGTADQQVKQEDDKRREQDAQRMKAAEGQLREGEARESSLRRQLDGLQGKLAEAEARAAVAGTAMGSAAHDSTLADLRAQIEKAEAQRRAFDAEKQQLARALAEAREEAAIARTSATAIDVVNEGEAAERVRLAEAKAAKAIAAARAAQAGLTVSPADIAAIESGLVVNNHDARKGTPWPMIMIAFVGGLGIMFAVWKLVLNKDTQAPAASATPPTATQPAGVVDPTPAPTATAKPVVTPIEEPGTEPTAGTAKPTVEPIDTTDTATAAADKAAADKAAADKAAADKAAADKAVAEPAGPSKAEKAAEAKAAKAAAAEAKAEKAAAAEAKAEKAAAAKAAKTTKAPKTTAPKATKTTKPAASGIADPFAETPAPKRAPAKKPAAKPAGGIVDPF